MGLRNDNTLFHVKRKVADVQTSSEKWERDCPGKRLRTDQTYDEYIRNYGMSLGERDRYERQLPQVKEHFPSERIIANPFNNFLITHREWFETYPAMRWLRQTEPKFEEIEIQRNMLGPGAIAEYFREGGRAMSACVNYFRFEGEDIDVPIRSIDPEGFEHYECLEGEEHMLKALMRSMKQDENQSAPAPSPRTAEAMHQYAAERVRAFEDRSRSREENRQTRH